MKNKGGDKGQGGVGDSETFYALHPDQQVEKLVKIGRAALGEWGLKEADVTLNKVPGERGLQSRVPEGEPLRNAFVG